MMKQNQQNTASLSSDETPVRITFVIEWANTAYGGIPRFWGMLNILVQQWQEVIEGKYPDKLADGAADFLSRLECKPEILVISGEKIDSDLMQKIQDTVKGIAKLSIHVKEGLEYYALKNIGGELATGDIICFLDSDVHPDDGWLAHLLGSFSAPHIVAAAGQPYVATNDLYSRAFALGWIFELVDKTGTIPPPSKFFSSNTAFRIEIFRRFKFPVLKKRTRGATSLLRKELENNGYEVLVNSKALVDHPAPSSLRHMFVRAIAHGRDYYMSNSEERSLNGLIVSQKTAAYRLILGIRNTFKYWREVGLQPIGIPLVIGILSSYYMLFSLGGFMTQISPALMGRRFRI